MKRLTALILCLMLLLTSCAAPEQEQGGGGVRTDWSQLGEREEPLPTVGTRWYEDYTDHLIPRADYGTLIPYAGLRLMDDWPADSGCLYGLMTESGVVVTDPVYSSVFYPSRWDGGSIRKVPLLILSQGEHTEEDAWNPVRYAVAAPDGSWCTGFDYRGIVPDEEGLMLLQEDGVTWVSPEGAVRNSWTAAEMGMTQEQFQSLLSDISWGEGGGGIWQAGYFSLGWADDQATRIRLFRLEDGTAVTMTYDEWMALCADGGQTEWWEIETRDTQTLLRRGKEEHIIPCVGPEGTVSVEDDLVLFNATGAVYTLEGEEILSLGQGWQVSWQPDSLLGADGSGLLLASHATEHGTERRTYRRDGTPLDFAANSSRGELWYWRVSLLGGLVEVLDWNTASYYDLNTRECVFRTRLNYDGE